MSEQMKERAAFYLRRYLHDLEDKGAGKIDHTKLAENNIPYEERQAIEMRSRKLQHEYETIQWLYDQLFE